MPALYSLGLSDWAWPSTSSTGDLAQLSAKGLRFRRFPFDLGLVFPAGSSAQDWSRPEAFLKACAQFGVTPHPVIVGVPRSNAYVPLAAADIQSCQFAVAAAVQRYGAGGSELARLGIPAVKSWQLFNEPNVGGRMSAVQYAEAATLVAGTIHGYDPAAKVVGAGMVGKPSTYSAVGGQEAQDCLGECLAYTASNGVAFKNVIDAYAVHCYQVTVADQLDRIAKVQAKLRTYPSQAAKGVWVTESSWPTGGNDSYPTIVTESVQDGNLDYFFDSIAQRNDLDLGAGAGNLVAHVNWFGYADLAGFTSGAATASHNSYFGLRRVDGSSKPSEGSFAAQLAMRL